MKTQTQTITTYKHQGAFIHAPYEVENKDIRYFFMVAGYRAGKSWTVSMMIIVLAMEYRDHPIRVCVGAFHILFGKQTLMYQVFSMCATLGITYEYSGSEHILRIGRVEFLLLAFEQPQLLFGHNCSVFICDEFDELKEDKVKDAFTAIQERARDRLPATKNLPERAAYTCFLTTSQGYKGTYRIIEDLKEKGEPYWIIHAKSSDNGTTDPEWLESMRKWYDEVQGLVYLDGQFANLGEGRVYPRYDESKCMLKTIPFSIEPQETIRIGQDLNVGFSCGCATVTRNGVIHVVKLWRFKEIHHAAKMIDTEFHDHHIEWYPDASNPDLTLALAAEMRTYGIKTLVGTVNPGVTDRIFFINALLEAGLLVLWPNCGPLSMALKLRRFNDKGDPEKGKGQDAPDHPCDSLEYVVWRIVCRDPEFIELRNIVPEKRRHITDRQIP